MKDPAAPHHSQARGGSLQPGRSSTSPAPHRSQARGGSLQPGRSSTSPAPHRALRVALLVLAAALSSPLAGCGEDSSDSACPTLPPGAEASPLPTPQPCGDDDAG